MRTNLHHNHRTAIENPVIDIYVGTWEDLSTKGPIREFLLGLVGIVDASTRTVVFPTHHYNPKAAVF